MNRGRIRWDDLQHVLVPLRDPKDSSINPAVAALEAAWKAHAKLVESRNAYLGNIAEKMALKARKLACGGSPISLPNRLPRNEHCRL